MANNHHSPVRLRDVAREAGVSQGTASNVFNRPDVVRDEVRDRVLKAAERLGYSGPSVTGRLLRAGKVNAVGVAAIKPLSYFFDDLWARNMLSKISAICDSQGAGIALVSAISDERLDWNIQSAVVDGFILLCVEGGERLVEITRSRKLPYVALAIGASDMSIPAIGVDNVHGARLAAEHLVSLGHNRLCILSTKIGNDRAGSITEVEMRRAKNSTSRDRALGYWQALEAAGISIADTPIMLTLEDEQSTYACMARLFSEENRPTGILAMSDKIALWAIDWLRRNQIAVPTEVSVIGFDGVPEALVSSPSLTTIEQPTAEIAQRAVQAALGADQIEGRRILRGRLIVRQTTAPAF
ncbi:LacI family DNA-binding transcriptional regulator [Agrobacterium vitis]|uniref:LacI family DNA-binding transcriptional regulator n=1 Tax=Agrobacterium vitis TaxID=373 RepID=UPI00157479E6|nr:LacI family DNA-binding transcriptional regulator [Agrobacterium vitis]NSZ17160.1 LacI family transcriptional regulator [Agrobacterium vitis]QZO02889.1 LacI family transcriptional regulator [Agrobacterium vitis]UJL88014.1 LacI family DNA-binding transcriptional regulator [Agrobacterium vitis]